jgi:peptidoglycan/xylan/chitin deacetylase (PgdA/CDA1 family)
MWRIRWVCALLSILVVGRAVSQDVVSTPVPAAPSADIRELPSPVWDGTLRRIHVPILMYHYISDIPAGADAIRTNLSVSPTQFREQLDYLFFNGYTPISLYALHDALISGAALPAKPVVLTFDDGYIDHYMNAFALLRERNFIGTFFVITGLADQNNPDYLSWVMIREMADAGMSMESHTKTHMELRGRTYDQVVYEVLGSLESIAYYTGVRTHMFCFPVGRFDDATLGILEQTELWRAVTTERGALHTTDNRLLMPRVRISNDTSIAAFAALLADRDAGAP